jgi:formylglycine-generating enzyme required for sulfatase activity
MAFELLLFVFVLSAIVFFNARLRQNYFAIGGAGLIAIVSLYFLSQEIAAHFVRQELIRKAATLKPSDVFKDCDNCPEMVVVPAGSFIMGSAESEQERSTTEGPQHRVTFAQSFAVGKFSVTFEEWDACVADGYCNGYRPSDQGWGRGRHPVINVGWNDAYAYAVWLSRKTGAAYRLLSEAEREYVARAGTTTPFSWGSSISPQQANYDGNYTYGDGTKGEYRQRTLPVDSFQPNPWGLYQVHGNVWEWTQDCWHDNYAGAPSDGSAWKGGCRGYRVVRGGSWSSNPKDLRAAYRYYYTGGVSEYPGGVRYEVHGFRVGRTLFPYP